MAGLIPGRTAEYRKRLTDPNKRKTIPDEYLKALNPALYSKRRDNQRIVRNNALYDPTRLLTGSEIYSTAKAQASGAYDPLINDATTQRRLAIANDTALAQRVAGYNQMAGDAVSASLKAAQSGQAQLATTLANTHSAATASMDQGQRDSQQFATDDAALRGSDVTAGLSQRLASDFQQQRAGIQANMAAQENAGNAAGAGWTGLIGMMQGAQAMRGADTNTQIATGNANREAGLQQDINKLKTAKLTDPQTGLEANLTRLRQSEFEKGAAMQTLNIKGQTADTAAAKAAADITGKETTYDKETAKWAAKIGLTPSQFMKLGPTGRQQRIDAYNRKQRTPKGAAKDGKLYTSGAFAGYTDKEVAAMSQGKRQDVVTGYNKLVHPGKAPKDATAAVGGIKQQTPLEQSHASSQVQHTVKGILPDLKSGKGIENPGYDPKKPKGAGNKEFLVDPKKGGYSRSQAAAIIMRDPKSPSPALVSAALDMAYLIPPHISAGTAAKLHREGLSVAALGLPVNKTISQSRPN